MRSWKINACHNAYGELAELVFTAVAEDGFHFKSGRTKFSVSNNHYVSQAPSGAINTL